jgi:deoxycytidylate deaminase
MVDKDEVAQFLKTMIISSNRYFFGKNKFYVAAATLDKRGRVIAIGENSSIKTHPLMQYYSCLVKDKHKIYLHAEISALVKSQREVETLVVVRVNKHGKMALAKPCSVCQLAIKDARVKKIFYSTEKETLISLT